MLLIVSEKVNVNLLNSLDFLDRVRKGKVALCLMVIGFGRPQMLFWIKSHTSITLGLQEELPMGDIHKNGLLS